MIFLKINCLFVVLLKTEGLITIPIMDASGRATVMSHSNGYREVAVNNQQSFFQFNRGQMYSEADLEVTVTCTLSVCHLEAFHHLCFNLLHFYRISSF